MNVPLLDLKAQHRAIRDTVVAKVLELADSQLFILGKPVQELEAKVAELSRARYGVGVASGTDALLLPLKALDLKPGDEVITTPFTFFATAGAIHNAGGKPVFVDIERDTFNIDPAAVEAAITPRTRAIMPVHLFGQMAAMERLLPLAERHGVPVVEDAAQSIGARRRIDGRWRMAGELGAATGFSFFPTKNLGGVGRRRDGGRQRPEAGGPGAQPAHARRRADVPSRRGRHQLAARRAPGGGAAGQAPLLASWSAARRANAARYGEALAGLSAVRTPVVDPANEHIFHQYVIEADRRDALQAHLKQREIGCAVYYPLALHLQPCFGYLGVREGAFPVAEAATRRVLALPVYPELSEAQQQYVADTIRGYYGT